MPDCRCKDQKNLEEFYGTVVRAYKQERRCGNIPRKHVDLYDKLIQTPAIVRPKAGRGWVHPIEAHRLWRHQVIRMYKEDKRGGSFFGLFDFDWEIDWHRIFKWIADNIVKIVKTLVNIVPMIIV
jgi:hypothetical protein